jgi:ubiquinol-cytochrome c reductase cytochrome c subunit
MRRSILLLLGLLLAACGYVDRPAAPYQPPAIARTPPIEDGETLYLRACAWCHGDRGQGTERGPDLVTGTNGPALTHFMLSTGRMPIDHPEESISRRPSFYTPEQIEAIIAFVETFGTPGPSIPEVDSGRGDLGEGLALYHENCAACHATTGIGGAMSSSEEMAWESRKEGTIAPPLDDSTPLQVAEAMLTGPGTMPVFGPETFSQREVDSIVAYVQELQDAANPGGVPMGKIGPWSEGAAGWLVGLGSLLVLSRWLGTRGRRSHNEGSEEP